jgi:tetratricopeptide (TPR) repeat protein
LKVEFEKLSTDRRLEMRGSSLVLLLIAVGTFGFLTLNALLRVEPMQKPLPEPEPSNEQLSGEVAPFQPQELTQVQQELQGYFSAVQRATTEQISQESVDLFDFPKLYQASRSTDQLPVPEMPVMDGTLLWKLTEATLDGLRAGWLGKHWQSTVIRQVQRLSATQCVVLVRHQLEGQTIPAQWWMVRSKNGWQAYDFEDLRLGLKLSVQIAGLFQEPENVSAERDAAIKALAGAQTALQSGEFADAEALLKNINAKQLPVTLQPVYRLTEGALALSQNKPEAALKAAEQLETLRPNMPGIHLLKATAQFRLKNWSGSVASAKAYIDLLGADPHASLTLALAQSQLGQIAEARATLELAIQEFPGQEKLKDALDDLNRE